MIPSLFAFGCCAVREREVVEVAPVAEVPQQSRKVFNDDGVESAAIFFSLNCGEDGVFSYPLYPPSEPTTVGPDGSDVSEGDATEAPPTPPPTPPLTPPADEEEAASGDQALVLLRVAGNMPGGKLSEWQRRWCTPQTVQRHLDARRGDVDKASEILAEALRQRDEFQDVLSFVRQPVWQSDLRVLARGEDGHTCVYFCFRHQVDRPSARPSLEHIALVLEVAVRQLQHQATTFDVVCDCHGMKISRNLDPRVALGFASLLKHSFRDRLRLGVVVDAGPLFGSLWRVFAPALPAKTKEKIMIASGAETLEKLSEVAGKSVADAVAEQMRANRSSTPQAPAARMPTELEDEYRS